MRDRLTHLFTPHQSNNHRPKILSNSGLALLVGIFLFTQASLKLISISDGVGGYVLGYASSITTGQVIDLTNQERAKIGLSPLTHNSALSNAAAGKANHMFSSQYWAHIAPDGTSPWYFIKNAGYSYSVAGENLARDFGDTSSVMVAWMNSPTHRDNIVNSKYSEIGVAVVDGVLNGVETTLVVQMFGSQVRTVAATSPQAVSTEATEPEVKSITDEKSQPVETIETTKTQEVETIEQPEELVTEPKSVVLSAPQDLEPAKVRISPLTLTKVFSSSIVALIILVLAYDLLISRKKKLVRLVGKNWAHFSFLGVILIIVYASVAGQII